MQLHVSPWRHQPPQGDGDREQGSGASVVERNGMSAAELGDLAWRKSRHSGANGGNCVEIAATNSGNVAFRHSREPEGPALIYSRDEFRALIRGVRDGEFDSVLHGGRQVTGDPMSPRPDMERRGRATSADDVAAGGGLPGASKPREPGP
ncbi:MAG: DUF397 domain-containing protein [Phycicoccus sp.]